MKFRASVSIAVGETEAHRTGSQNKLLAQLRRLALRSPDSILVWG